MAIQSNPKPMNVKALRSGVSSENLIGKPRFQLGIVMDSSVANDPAISAISKPASSCCIAAVVVLNPPEDDNFSDSMGKWLCTIGMEANKNDVHVLRGEEGLKQLLSSEIDGVYIAVPHGSQRDKVLMALKAGKHVLLDDPVSTSMEEFVEQHKLAKEYGKFIQFSTLFVHQVWVRRFMDVVIHDASFGVIDSIEAALHVSYSDVHKIGVSLPLGENDGSIRILGRFCILVSALFYSQHGSYAQSAKVLSLNKGSGGETVGAKCLVKFSHGGQLKFDVGYTHSATRQKIEVEADNKLATMNDFVIAHPDGLATYRVYEKSPNSKKDHEVTQGEAIDLAGGAPQYTMMWRKFASLCASLDDQGGWDQSEETLECRLLVNVALQTKRAMIALEKSAENGFEEVIIDDIDYE